MCGLDLLCIASFIGAVVGLAIRGSITPELAAFAFVGLVICLAVARSVKSKFIGGLFRIVPLLLSWIGILVAASSGDLRTAGPVFASLLAMVIMRVAIYEMVKGVVK